MDGRVEKDKLDSHACEWEQYSSRSGGWEGIGSRMTRALPGFAGEPSGAGGRGESWRDDTACLTECEEPIPQVGGDNVTAVGSKEALLEVEGTKEVAGWVRKLYGCGVGDEFGAVGRGGGWEQLDGTVVHNAVRRADGEAVPLRPPTS